MTKKQIPIIILFECSCPAPTALTEIPEADCPINLGQIQKYGFQISGDSFDLGATTPTDIKALADWQVKRTAVDSTKITVSPLIGADPVITAGEAITTGGGDNTTFNGIEEVEGVNPSSASVVFKSLTPEIEKSMKTLSCVTSLTVYFFLQGGRIAAKEIVADQEYSGFPIQAFFFSDRTNEGNATKDMHTMSFQLPAGWSEDLKVFDAADLDFNPIIDL